MKQLRHAIYASWQEGMEDLRRMKGWPSSELPGKLFRMDAYNLSELLKLINGKLNLKVATVDDAGTVGIPKMFGRLGMHQRNYWIVLVATRAAPALDKHTAIAQ
jgi:hypothetical protein